MKNYFINVEKILSKNIKNVIEFEFIFKLITSIIALPVFLGIAKLIMKTFGYSYITIENLIYLLCNPVILILFFILLLIIVFYSIFDIGTIILLFDASWQNKKVKLKDIIILSLKKSIKVFKPKNFGILILVLFLIPFLNIGMSTGVITSLNIPEFILDFILNNNILCPIFYLIIFLLLYLLIKWMYALHYYFLDDKSFKDACKCSNALSKKSKLKDFGKLILPEIIIQFTFILSLFFSILLIILIDKVFGNIDVLNTIFISFIVLLMIIFVIIYTIFNNVIGYACISEMFYEHKNNKKEKINYIEIKENDKVISHKKWKAIKIIMIILGIISFTALIYGLINNKYNYDLSDYYKNIEITAHRGASMTCPENTMAAFVKANELGADWIELDIQQTKDKVVVVSHDTNLKRVTGKNIDIWDATYDEIAKLDAGSFKGEEFKGEKIPLFEDVVKWAKENNVKLNIEIKPTGYEEDFEKEVIDIVKKYDYQNDCVITSQMYYVLENIKDIDNSINTVYVMSVAIGDVTKFDKADHYSIEASNINEDMVTSIHKKGKKIYAWTINDEDLIRDMFDLGVDNIITDEVTLAQKVKEDSINGTFDIYTIINYIYKNV